jgi:hypothetical protein
MIIIQVLPRASCELGNTATQYHGHAEQFTSKE